jgi:hypothetical protein
VPGLFREQCLVFSLAYFSFGLYLELVGCFCDSFDIELKSRRIDMLFHRYTTGRLTSHSANGGSASLLQEARLVARR